MKIAADPARTEEASALGNQHAHPPRAAQRSRPRSSGIRPATGSHSRRMPSRRAMENSRLPPMARSAARARCLSETSTRFPARRRHFTASASNILPDSDDPKKWPERGSLCHEVRGAARRCRRRGHTGRDEGGLRRSVSADPTNPAPSGNVGGFPETRRPALVRCSFRKSRSMPRPAARLGDLDETERRKPPATKPRRFGISRSSFPTTPTGPLSSMTRSASPLGNRRDEMATRYKAIDGTLVPVMVERPAPATPASSPAATGCRRRTPVTPGVPEVARRRRAGRRR